MSQPLEEAVNTVDGIAELRSISGSGASFVLLTFELERDIDTAAQDVRDRVASALRRLPRDIEAPQVFKMDNDSSPVMTVAVSGPRSLRELTQASPSIPGASRSASSCTTAPCTCFIVHSGSALRVPAHSRSATSVCGVGSRRSSSTPPGPMRVENACTMPRSARAGER